jgi:hypothetical protein
MAPTKGIVMVAPATRVCPVLVATLAPPIYTVMDESVLVMSAERRVARADSSEVGEELDTDTCEGAKFAAPDSAGFTGRGLEESRTNPFRSVRTVLCGDLVNDPLIFSPRNG